MRRISQQYSARRALPAARQPCRDGLLRAALIRAKMPQQAAGLTPAGGSSQECSAVRNYTGTRVILQADRLTSTQQAALGYAPSREAGTSCCHRPSLRCLECLQAGCAYDSLGGCTAALGVADKLSPADNLSPASTTPRGGKQHLLLAGMPLLSCRFCLCRAPCNRAARTSQRSAAPHRR